MNDERRFHQKVDLPAVLGQFLTNTRAEDLIIELVQNEIDAGSTSTIIAFTDTALICEGDGEPIDSTGWERLDMVLGAGGTVAAKPDGIGAKNHGLRTGFLVGDDIVVQSGGWCAELTVCRDASKRRLDPGSWSRVADPDGPRFGTRIVIPYRREPIEVPSGEDFDLSPKSLQDLRRLYDQGIADAPTRFLSAIAVTPGWYRLEFHWRESEKRVFEFERAAARRPSPLELIRRTCRETLGDGTSKILAREAGVNLKIRLARGDHGKVPRLFRTERGVQGEITWNVDERGRPVPGIGVLRYPIAYPAGDSDAYSGHSYHVSAPFISDTMRHGLASASERNHLLIEQARRAMLTVLRRLLLPKHGPMALALLRRVDRPDLTKERKMAALLVEHGALLVRTKSKAGRINPPRLLRPGTRVTIARYADDPSRVSNELFTLAPPSAILLDERTPSFIIDALTQLDTDKVETWSDRDAIKRLIPQNEGAMRLRLGQPLDRGRLLRAIAALKLVQRAQDRGTLPAGLIQSLLAQGVLPTASGQQRRWGNIHFSRETIPEIDGVPAPTTLHPRLLPFRLFGKGALKLTRFRLDDYLTRLEFKLVGKASRDAFFHWLAKHHNILRPGTLAALAEEPFWPARDGSHWPLATFVLPRSNWLQEIVWAVTPQPSAALVDFPALRKSTRGALHLRVWPKSEELQAWYDRGIANVEAARNAGDLQRLHTDLLALETALTKSLEERQLSEFVTSIAPRHLTLSKASVLASVKELHLPTQEVQLCQLLEADLVAGSAFRLYEHLGARSRPSTQALLCALTNDAADGDLLFRRLQAYESETPLATLCDLSIIPIDSEVCCPSDLALPQKADLWGRWKRSWSPADLTPDRVALLVAAGVARNLTETLSAAFFRWLAEQRAPIQADHLAQAHRHFRDRHRGPLKWWSGESNLPCLPTRGPDNIIELASYNRATSLRSSIYLPDFPDVHDEVLKRDRSKRLAITDIEGLSGTLFAPLRQAGIRSLRRSFGRPIGLTATGEACRAGHLVEAVLQRFCSDQMLAELPKRLELQGLNEDMLRPRWRTYARAQKEVRLVKDLRATFVFSGLTYNIAYPSGVDPVSGYVWLSEGRDPIMLLYEALASFIFEEGVDPLAPYGLMRALEMPFSPAGQIIELEGSSEELAELPDMASSTPAVSPQRGHGVTGADYQITVPTPKPFSQVPIQPRPGISIGASARHPRPAASSSGLRGTVQELEQTRQLKEDHYAWHCQACLGKLDVTIAAPAETYVALPKYRRGLIEAHHVDHLQNQGALGAGNLIVLCKYHHDLLGDRLTGAMIRQSLESAVPLMRNFPKTSTDGSVHAIYGLGITIAMDATPFEATLFFTHEHAAAWERGLPPTNS